MNWGRWGTAVSPFEYPSAWTDFESGLPAPGDPFGTYQYTAFLSPTGNVRSDGFVEYIAGGSAQRSDGAPLTLRVNADALGGVLFDVGQTRYLNPLAGLHSVNAVISGNVTISGRSRLMRVGGAELNRDEWDTIQEVPANDYLGATIITSGANARYRGLSNDFPLVGGVNIGQPNTGDYTDLVSTTISSTQYRQEGTGQFVTFSNPTGSGKAEGSYIEDLDLEDTEVDAIDRVRVELEKTSGRAPGSVVVVSSPTAYHRTRGDGFTFSAQRAFYSALFDIKCPGFAEFVVHYTVAPAVNPSAVQKRSVSFRKQLSAGLQEISVVAVPSAWASAFASLPKGDFTLEVGQADTDYTITKVELIQPCGGGGDGGELLNAIGSVRSHFTLGRGPAGGNSGVIRLEADTVSAALYSPAALLLAAAGDGTVAEVRNAAGVLRQVKAPQVFADIVTLSASSYELRFHALANVGTADPVTGVYTLSGTPFAVYRIEDPTPASPGLGLRITETRGSLIKVIAYTRDATTGALTLSTGNGLRRETMLETISGNTRSTVTTVLNPDDTVALKVARTYQTFPDGREEMTSETLDPDGAALATTWEYDATGRLLGVQRPDGSWENYSGHDSLGRPTLALTPFGQSAYANTDPNAHRATTTVYGGLADQDGDSLAEALTIHTDYVQGQRTGYRWAIEYTKPVVLAGESFARRADIVSRDGDASLFSATNLVTETLTYGSGPFAGRPRRVVNPDGTATLTTYALDATGSQTMVQKTGAPNAAKDDITDGTRTTTFTNASGHVTGEAVVDIASNLTLTSWTATQFDALGRPTRMDHADGTYETRDYACCGLASRRDRDGTVTSWTYDALGRPTHQTANGITVRTAYDAEGRTLGTTRIGSDASEFVQETLKYDPAGRLIERRDALNRLTTILEELNPTPAIARRVTTTAPDGGTRIEAYQRDGTLLSVSGTAVAPLAYTYGTGSTREIRVGDGGATTEWTQTTYDHAGRPRFTTINGAGTINYFYNNAGQLIRSTDPDGVATLYAYNARGEQTVTAVDMNGNGVIDYAGTDRLTRTTSTVAQKTVGPDTFTVQRTTTEVWETDGADTPVTVSISETTPDGLRTWQTVRGLTTSTVTVHDGTGGRTVTTTAPDGTLTTQTYVSGRLSSQVTSHSSLGQLSATAFAYDAHGRLQTSTDARNGTTSFSYHNDDQLHTVTTPDPDPTRTGDGYDPQTTTYGYDAAGRLSQVTDPDGGIKVTEYYPTGQVKKYTGVRQYPEERTYDAQGRLKTLKTWQNYAADSGAAVTTWNYDPVRGLPLNKRYHDNTGPSYTHTLAGRLRTRTLARGVTVTYGYNTAGGLITIDYSDATPDVVFQLDRTGRRKLVTDASGTRTLSYHATGALEDEIYSAGLLAGLGVDRSFDSLARLSGLSVLGSTLNATGFAYDATSRLETITSGVHSSSYAYLPNSPLVQTITFRQGVTTRLVTTKAYDNLNRLSSVGNLASAGPAISVAYLYNSANQRTRATQQDGAYWGYGYDGLGQVVAARKRLPGDVPALGLDHAWTFDDIGNRKTATLNGQTSNYSANLLNQYASRSVPGALELRGEAQSDATVTYTINSGLPQPVTRQGGAYFKQHPLDNSAANVGSALKVTGVKNLVGAAGEDAVTEVSRFAFTPKTPETYVHDADGNLTDDARWKYTWDGENRLIAVETQPAAVVAGAPRQKTEFVYDSESRRVAKKVYNWNTPSGIWALSISLRYVYDNDNLLAEIDDSGVAIRAYAWGLDLSGSMEGARGVGGLLFANSNVPAYDGNGNIVGYVDMSTGDYSATYEYGAFGETLVAEGPAAESMPFRFSTKYHHDHLEFYDFGRRDYRPLPGRFLNRDPIEEEGGDNLYGFVVNDALSLIDVGGGASTVIDHAETRDQAGSWPAADDRNLAHAPGSPQGAPAIAPSGL